MTYFHHKSSTANPNSATKTSANKLVLYDSNLVYLEKKKLHDRSVA